MRPRNTYAAAMALTALTTLTALAPAAPSGAAVPPLPSRHLYVYAAAFDDIEVRGAVDEDTLAVTNTPYVRLQDATWLQAATTSGTLRPGLTSPVSLPPHATGTIRLTLDGDDVRARADVTIDGVHRQWDKVVFTL